MSPSIAESAVQRGRFAWVLGVLAASVTTMLVVAIPRTHHHRAHHSFERYHGHRVGHCHEYRFAARPQ
jgi:hypothetical protein